jgi:hypothetical protein
MSNINIGFTINLFETFTIFNSKDLGIKALHNFNI